MPRVSTQEFERLPLRVHAFLAGVPIHDVWAVDLPRTRPGITLDEFLRTRGARPYRLSPVVRALLSIRLFIGRLLGWDREPTATAWEPFATRLTTADRSKSLVAAGMRAGLLQVAAAALQYVRKVSGLRAPSAADRAVFERAVAEIAHCTEHLLEDLSARTAVRTREGEREKAHLRGVRRGVVRAAPAG